MLDNQRVISNGQKNIHSKLLDGQGLQQANFMRCYSVYVDVLWGLGHQRNRAIHVEYEVGWFYCIFGKV